MRYRRKSTGRTRPCSNPSCSAQAPRGRGFCRPCWFKLESGVRLTIQEARIERLYKLARFLSLQVGHQLARRETAGRGAEPAVAICGRCELRTTDPVVASCTDPLCPHALRRAA